MNVGRDQDSDIVAVHGCRVGHLRTEHSQTFIRLLTLPERVVLSSTGQAENGALVEEHRELEIVTLLGFDGIPSILNSTFVST